MATYTVIQDIEAEDKFLGPLTLKQFIFGAAGIFFGYLGFFAVSQGAAFMLIVFLPPMLLGFFLAIPWSKEQPTELWVIAKLRFRLKPKIRFWDQSGLEELVTITVPKKIERHLTNGLDQTEVESRLKALADTIDSRGWVTKHAELPQAMQQANYSEERLLDPTSVRPMEVPDIDINSYTDVLDTSNNVSSHFEQMIQQKTISHRQELDAKMDRIRHGERVEDLDRPPATIQYAPPAAPANFDEQLLSQQLREQRATDSYANQKMHTIPTTPVVSTPVQQIALPEPQAPMTQQSDPDIIRLSQRNDLDVATLGRQMKKTNHLDDGEVVVSLR